MLKNETVLKKWYLEAYNKAKRNGLKRIINHNVLFKYLMSPNNAFTTTSEDKRRVITIIYTILMDLEKICEYVDKEGISENTAQRARDFLIW